MASAAGPVEQGLGRLWDSAPGAKAAEVLIAVAQFSAGKYPVLFYVHAGDVFPSAIVLTSCLSHPVS